VNEVLELTSLKISVSKLFEASAPWGLFSYFLTRFFSLAVAQFLTGLAIILLSLILPEATSRILGTYIPSLDFPMAAACLAVAVVTAVLLHSIQLIQSRLVSSASESVGCVLQRSYLRRCLALPMQWHLINGPAAANRSFFYDISILSELVSSLISSVVFPIIQILLVLGVLFIINPVVAAISMFPISMMAIISWRSFNFVGPAAADQIKEANKLGKVFFDFVSCVRLVKAFCIESAVAKDIRPRIEKASTTVRRLYNLNSFFSILSNLSVALGGLFVLGIGLYLIMQQGLDLADLLRFVFFSALLYQPFERLSSFMQNYYQSKESWDNIRANLLKTGSRIPRKGLRARFPGSTNMMAKNISFAYNGRLVINSVSLSVEEGEMIGIMGRSGSGKTTLLSILSGYLTPTCGSVTIGNVDLEYLSRPEIFRNILYAGQEAMLFNRSIRFNLQMARPSASEGTMWDALEKVDMHDTVSIFPEKLDHIVGDHGTMLSGGERQRLLMAMVWLRNPKILLLDEINAALDPITERLLRESLQKLMTGRTTIVVSHRLETLVPANRIYVMEKGSVQAVGKHSNLLETCDLYRQLWKARLP